VRAGEANDMRQAMNTAHDGSMTTVHANTPRDALSRLEQMIGMSGIDIPAKSSRAQVASAINVVVQVSRLSDGRRKLVSLSEITGMEGEVVTMQEIFRFRQSGIGTDGIVQGRFEATGIRPRFLEQVIAHGLSLSSDLFRPDARFEA
jgi:pilus assembly protein CpaF